MLTMFSTPKPFVGHFGVIQTNAMESWSRLRDVEVVLFGDSEGTAEICARLGLKHVPHVQVNEYGTPLLSDLFAQTAKLAPNDIMCFANADIIFMPDFRQALDEVRTWRNNFLVVGRRCDMDVRDPIDFGARDWAAQLRMRAATEGKLQTPEWIDYFAFSRSAFPRIPPFAVGRAGWDNYVLWNARARKVPVVDATLCVHAVHQNHDYSHYFAGQHGVRHGVEATKNTELIGTWSRMFTIADSNYRLTQSGVKRNLTPEYARRRLVITRRRFIDWTRPLRRRLGLRMLNKTWQQPDAD